MTPSDGNAAKIPLAVSIYEDYFLGQKWMRSPELSGGFKMGSFLFFMFPFAFVLYFLHLLRCGNRSWQGMVNQIKKDPTVFVILVFVFYNTLISCMLTYDENERYKFDIEQIFYVGLVGLFYQFYRAKKSVRPSLPDTFQ